MLNFITQIMNSLGYLGVVLLMILENVFPPLPSELIMPLAGFVSTQGKLSFAGVAIAGMTGSVLGALPFYYLGKALGTERLKAWADKHGKWLALSGDDIGKADQWFDQHGDKTVLIGRLVPGIRSLVSIPAGVSGMPLPKFLLYSAIGTGVWATALAYAGVLLGKNYSKVEQYIEPVSWVVMGALVLAFGVTVIRRRKAS
ncbi:MAG: DedA family protein [Capsulimonas sp.]|uniref:DedA family protein n=1 Tax=Capsulimonas sp. TaxID=2494211 RepID=UPI003265499C